MNLVKALFLDRDGVINEDIGYVYRVSDFKFIDGIFDLCKKACALEYIIIIVTNQAGIARGFYTEEDFDNLTKWMIDEFSNQGIYITDLYSCFYHPEFGIGEYRVDSFDRKPNPGMIFKARDEYNINLSDSIFIGDKDSDMTAGRNAGVGKLLFLQGNYPFSKEEDVYVCSSLAEAAGFL